MLLHALAVSLSLPRAGTTVGLAGRAVRRGYARALCTAASGFDSLGLHPLLLMGVSRLGLRSPTEIQRRAFGVVSEGKDAVLLDETGSGKTLAYALPVLHAMLGEKEAMALAEEEGNPPQLSSQALILVPNRELCLQVHNVLQPLLLDLPRPLRLRSSALTEPDANADLEILVSTPSAAVRSWRGSGRGSLRGPCRVRWCVLDEADQLLAGSFKPAARASYPVEQVLEKLKAEGRKVPLGEAEAAEQERDERAAAAKVRKAASPDERTKAREGLRAARSRRWSGKQFVLAAATMPNAGQRNVEAHVLRHLPLAEWVRTGREHREVPSLQQYFVKVSEQQRGEALRQAIKQGPKGQTLVFANTLATAEAALEELQGVVSADLFHKEVPPEDRRASLAAFDAGELPVLVCTGLAARGIDFRAVTHVVQYEVANNVVEYMHRVGRTARAGRSGTATTLYDESSAELVEAVRAAVEARRPIDHLFSRKRSLRKRIKRYGTDALTQQEPHRPEEGHGPQP